MPRWLQDRRRAKLVWHAAVLDKFDAGLEGIDINGTADDGFVLIQRRLDIHGDVIEEAFFEELADDVRAAAVGVEFDG